MKRTKLLALLVVALALITNGCGTSDSVKSISLSAKGTTSGVANIVGADGTLQLVATAVYNSGKLVDVTNKSTWTVSTVCCDQNGADLLPYGPTTVPINATGVMTAIEIACTWNDTLNTTVTPAVYWNPPVWVYTGYYQVTATYNGMVSQPLAVGVGSATSNTSPIGGCGPS